MYMRQTHLVAEPVHSWFMQQLRNNLIHPVCAPLVNKVLTISAMSEIVIWYPGRGTLMSSGMAHSTEKGAAGVRPRPDFPKCQNYFTS